MQPIMKGKQSKESGLKRYQALGREVSPKMDSVHNTLCAVFMPSYRSF